MLTLSIQQPWAWAIVNGHKDIENRSWPTAVRGLVLVHAGKRVDKDGFDDIEMISGIKVPADLPVGGIVGVVRIVDCVNAHASRWFFGEWGFVLSEGRPLPFVPYRGQLGFFEVDYQGAQKDMEDRQANIQQPQPKSTAGQVEMEL